MMAFSAAPFPTRTPPADAAMIQLCPWYVKATQKAKIQILGDFQDFQDISLARSEGSNRTWVRGGFETPMDVLKFLDVSLLHELTHTLPNGINTYDLGGRRGAYGWRNCVKWSRSGQATLNAENYMFFALGAKLISPNPGVRAQRPMLDGTIQVLDTRRHSRRDLHGAHSYASLGTRASDRACFMGVHENNSKSTSMSRNAACKQLPSRRPSSSNSSNSSVPLEASSTMGHIDADHFTTWDFSAPSWIDLQQSILLEALADDTEPYIVWSPPNKSTTVNAKQMLSGSY